MNDSPACFFFLAVYAATSNRGCFPGKAISGGKAVLAEAAHLSGDAVMSDAFSRTGRKQTRATFVEGDLGGGSLFAEVARVESSHAASARYTGSCHGEKATLD